MKTKTNYCTFTRLTSGARQRASIFIAALFCSTMLSSVAMAQLSGTKNIPGDYATLAAAITDLNTQGVDTGGVTLNLLAGNPETAPAGGYVIGGAGSLVLTTTSAANPVIIQGNANTITASAAQTVGNLNDAIFKLIGADWITVTGFTMQENPANTVAVAATNNMTEWGVALLYVTTTDGCSNDTITGNTITLNRTYPNTFGIYSNSTHTATAVATSATATGATGGNHSLTVYGNNISNVNMGIVHIGPTAAADQNTTTDIGGAALATGNTITDFGTTTTGLSGYANLSATINGILVRNTKNFNISFNTVNSSNGGVIVGTLNGIQIPGSSNAPTGTLAQTINNNSISLRPGAIGITTVGITMPSTSVNATTTCNFNNNDFNTFGHTVAGATGTITFISQAGNPLVQNFNNNTFTNMSVNTTGTITFFSFAPSLISTASMSLSGNSIVTGFTRTSVGSTTVWSSNASSVAGSFQTNNNNNFSNITLTGASAFNGIVNTDGGTPTKSVNGNTFSNITTGAGTVVPMSVNFSAVGSTVNNNTITGITTSNSITALLLGSSNAGLTASGNTIDPIISGGTSVIGISTASPSIVLTKSKIYDLSGTAAGSVVSGIAVVGTTSSSTVTLSNNLIGNLTAAAATGANAVIGINITGSATTSNYNVFYNTVYLSNPTSGAGFGSSGISALASATATTSTLNLRNNVIVNTSVQNGAGLTVAYRRSSGVASTLANYGSTSNNNDFYAGTPSATNLIYFDGTSSAQTISAYKSGLFTAGTIAPRDSASLTENPPFLSTIGSSANFLHIDPATPTQLESAAAPIAGITTDFDGDTRNASTPDIGADEFSGILLDLTPPNIVYATLGNTSLFTARTLTATITDASGVPTAGPGLPVLYWKINAGAYTSATATSLGSGQYQFTFGSGVALGDVVSYYVAAQDNAATPNVTTNPSGGASGFTANPPAASTPPTTPNSYTILPGIAGSFTVGGGGDYGTITAAVADINGKVLKGPVVLKLLDSSYTTAPLATGETFPIVINANGGSSATNTITIKPDVGVVTSITGSATTALIKLNGASFVTIDGSNSGGTDRSLTIENTSATTPSVLLIGSVGTAPVTNDTVMNCVLRNGVNTSSAVVVSDATTLGNAGVFANVTVQNNSIQKAFVGVFATGGTIPQGGSNLVYTGNDLSTSGANAIRNVGLYMQGVNGATVSNNTIGNFDAATAENDVGIWLATGSINATVSGNTVSGLSCTASSGAPIGINVTPAVTGNANDVISQNSVSNLSTLGSSGIFGIVAGSTSGDAITVERNNVQNIQNNNTGTFGAFGIELNGGNNHVVKNNFVSNINHNMAGGVAFSTTFGVFGISVQSGSGHKVYNNSVNLFGLMPGAATTSQLSAAFALVSTGSQNCDVRNNIFANNITGGTTSIAHVSVYLPSGGTSAMNLTDNKNSYYFGTDTARQGVGQAGTTAGTNFFTTLSALAAYTSTLHAAATNDNASIASTGAVPYATATDLHIGLAAPEVDLGNTIGAVTDDIDGDTRPQGAAYDMGADEVAAFTVTYDANGGTGTQTDPNSPYLLGSTVTVLGTGTITRTGYTFTNWNTAANGSGTSYNPADTFTMPAANVTLFAQWTINSYTVTYDGNTNTGGTAPVDANSPYTFGSTVTVLGPGSLTKTGYTFAHWNTAANDSGTSYNPGDTFTMPAANVTLFAQWTINGPVTVSGSAGATVDGNYPSLTQAGGAFAAINGAGSQAGQSIIITILGDVTTEDGVNSLNDGGWAMLQINPSGARTVSGTAAAALINLNGADNVTINGLNSAGNSLIISNTSTSATASTIRLINGATNDMVTNCSVLGSSTGAVAAASGNILISTSTGGANSGNTISNNDIGPAGANLPSKGFTSLGSASPNNNTGNLIDNNNIFDFFNPTISVSGISLQANTTTMTVSNNRLYQTAARTFTGAALNYGGITSAIGTGAGTATITGNKVGFGAANGTGTTSISGSTGTFGGLVLSSASTTTPTSVQNNTVSGVSLSTAGNGVVVFNGIFFAAGRYDVGTTTGNKIGSLDGSSTITVTLSSNGAVYLMRDSTSSSNTIANNQIGAVTINGTGAGGNGFRGILLSQLVTTVTATLTNNQVGESGAGGITDTLVGGYALYAIANSSGNVIATGNTVQNISGNSNAATTIVISGMLLTGTGTAGGPNVISQNVIHSLSNNSGAASNSIYALYCSFPAATANVVERNFVHSLSITSTTLASQLVGILPVAGTGTYKNNMVRLGIDASGASITPGYVMYGMFEIAGTNNLYFNSVYIGGSGVASSSNTFAFVSNVVTNVRNYKDNIFWNARSNASGGGKNYAIAVGGTTPNPAGLTSNFNDLFASGTGGFVGLFNATDQATLMDWQAATGQDANSISGNPAFVNPDGTATTALPSPNAPEAVVDLHITCNSPADGAATPIAGVTNDFDNETRDATTPDIGADEINLDNPPTLVSAVSRKVHGAAGPFDITLPGVESRSGGAMGNYQVVFTFNTPVATSGAIVSSGTGIVSFVNAVGNTIVVDLTGVTNAQYLTVKLLCVYDNVNLGSVSATMGVLIGDAGPVNGQVNGTDVSQVKLDVGSVVDMINFRSDVDANGAINSSDVSLTKLKSGTALP